MTSSYVLGLIDGTTRSAPAGRLLGFTLRSFDPDAMTLEAGFVAREEFTNTGGGVQGGILCAMLDCTLGAALLGTLADGEWAPTVDLHAQFHSPARVGTILGRARVTRRGGSIAFVEGELYDEAGVVLASATTTSMIRRARPAG